MVNGHIDIAVILYQLGQYILVFFVGYLCWCGLISNIEKIKNKQIMHINRDLNTYKKKIELLKVKSEYKEACREKSLISRIKDHLPDSLYEDEEFIDEDEEEIDIDDSSEDASSILDKLFKSTEPKEVDIPTLDEVIAEEGIDFLKHSDDAKPLHFNRTNNEPLATRTPNPSSTETIEFKVTDAALGRYDAKEISPRETRKFNFLRKFNKRRKR